MNILFNYYKSNNINIDKYTIIKDEKRIYITTKIFTFSYEFSTGNYNIYNNDLKKIYNSLSKKLLL